MHMEHVLFGNPATLFILFCPFELNNMRRIHWFSSERRLKVVMPSMMQKCAGSWLIQTINRARGRGLMSDAWEDTIITMISPGMFLLALSSTTAKTRAIHYLRQAPNLRDQRQKSLGRIRVFLTQSSPRVPSASDLITGIRNSVNLSN